MLTVTCVFHDDSGNKTIDHRNTVSTAQDVDDAAYELICWLADLGVPDKYTSIVLSWLSNCRTYRLNLQCSPTGLDTDVWEWNDSLHT